MSEYKCCPSCLEQVLSVNFLLHSLYCERNIVQCELCDLRIDLNEKEEHMKLHQKKECSYCHENYEQHLLQSHQKNCPNKPSLCIYCDLLINQQDMVQHQVKCGSRTEQCTICKKHIQKKEFDIHLTICQQLQQPSPPKRARLKQVLCDSSDDLSVQEIKPNHQQKRPLKKELKSCAQNQKREQKDQNQQFQKSFLDDDEDEELQKALQQSLNQK
ncbi:unnamed protein product [Paramecium sonneborni]|uniref:TRAF-type domain-containing protein n=1 Tax=Paramecium sonneborni TaxID=65129 RepID=A0A8S1QJL2_9CILI|nr:unnamed protein product [Paramecium sonneborni]